MRDFIPQPKYGQPRLHHNPFRMVCRAAHATSRALTLYGWLWIAGILAATAGLLLASRTL